MTMMMQAQCSVTCLTDDGRRYFMTVGCKDREKCPHTAQSRHQLTTGMMMCRPARRL